MAVSSIEVVNQKLDSHIANQKEMTERLANNIDKLTETVSKVQVYEAALNTYREDLTGLKQITQGHADRIRAVEHQTELNTELRKDQKHIKTALIIAIITAAVTFGWNSLFPASGTVELSAEAIEAIKKGD